MELMLHRALFFKRCATRGGLPMKRTNSESTRPTKAAKHRRAFGQLSGRGLFQRPSGGLQLGLQAFQDPPKHFQSLDQPARQLTFEPFPERLLPPAFPLPAALTKQQAPSLGSDPLKLPLELLALTAVLAHRSCRD